MDDSYKLWWTAKFANDYKEELAVDSVKRLNNVHEGYVHASTLLSCFLHQLTKWKIPTIVLLPWRYPDCHWGYMESANR